MLAKERPHNIKHECAKVRQLALAVAFEQGAAQLRLKLFEGHRDRRLRPAQDFRRIPDVAMFGDGDKGAKGFGPDHGWPVACFRETEVECSYICLP